MIKINLLDSVTDRARGIIDVEKEVARPRTQTGMLAGVAGVLLLCACIFNYWSTNRALNQAKDELAEQQRIATQMAAIKKEKEELEKKIQAVSSRISAIQQLRASQRGPVAILEELRDRINNLPGLYLKSVEQKGDTLNIEGSSPNEDIVTRFGRSLEFSSGLFTNLNIETSKNAPTLTGATNAPAVPETITFKVRCNYTVPGTKEGENGNNAAAPAAAPIKAAAPAPPAPPAPNSPVKPAAN